MNLYKTKGIVVKNYYFGETDSIVVVLTRDMGKIRFIAKGVKKPASKLSSGSQTLVYSDFLIIKGKNLDRLRQCQIINSFPLIKNDLIKLGWASYIVELASEFIQEGEENTRLFDLLLKTLELLESPIEIRPLIHAFEIKLLSITGYLPNLVTCINCGQIDPSDSSFFSYPQGGIICKKCLKDNNDGIIITKETINTLLALKRIHLNKIMIIKIPDRTQNVILHLLRKYICYHLDKSPKSLKFLNLMEKEDAEWILP